MLAIALLALLALVGCRCGHPSSQAAVRVVATFNFRAGCVKLTAADAAHPASFNELVLPLADLEASPTSLATKRFAVFREKGWGPRIQLSATAHEASCSGPVVAREQWSEDLPERGVKEAAINLFAIDADGDRYVSRLNPGFPGTDCDDAEPRSFPNNPAGDPCDGVDNDCDGTVDTGLMRTWFVDADRDGFRAGAANALVACTTQAVPSPPPPFLTAAGNQLVPAGSAPGYTTHTVNDCNDGNAYIRPKEREEFCDGLDDDCDGRTDEDFLPAAAGTACTHPNGVCTGVFACAANRTSTACNAPEGARYSPDVDGDGAGDNRIPPIAVCGTPPPARHVTNRDDCNDRDPLTRQGATEVCDQRDNDCNNLVDDVTPACGAWTLRTDATGTHWQTVSSNRDGAIYPVWAAGESDRVAFKRNATTNFSVNQHCVGNWRASWSTANGSTLYLAGDDGWLASQTLAPGANPTPTSCASRFRANLDGTDVGHFRGIVGVGTGPTLFAATLVGEVMRWSPPATSVTRVFNGQGAVNFHDLHGTSASDLHAVGTTSGCNNNECPPRFRRYDGGTSWREPNLTAAPVGTGRLFGVWAVSPTEAYAVGENGLFFIWNGTAWSQNLAPTGLPTGEHFNAVHALGPSLVYAVSSAGKILRFDGYGWELLHSGGGELKDVIAGLRTDVWAVGISDRIYHWHQ